MASVNFDTLNSKWYTNFYYEEELRSVLMNGTLNSGFKPGVYNANMALFCRANSRDEAAADGLYLYIGKGTTLVFSNYPNTKLNDFYHQDLTETGTYLIKCTALQDMEVSLITLGSTKTSGCDYILGNDSSTSKSIYPVPKFYVTAYVIYDEETNLSMPNPTITISYDNFNGMEEGLDRAVQDVSSFDKLTFYCPTGATATTSSGTSGTPATDNFYYYYRWMDNVRHSYWIPDGSKLYARKGDDVVTFDSTTVKRDFLYLHLGEVISTEDIDNVDSNGESSRKCYLDGSSWNDTYGEFGGSAARYWTMHHVFVGRGFPCYRQNFISNKKELSPELVPSYRLDRLYLDVKNVFERDILYNSTITNDSSSWEGPLGIGNNYWNMWKSSNDEEQIVGKYEYANDELYKAPYNNPRQRFFALDYECDEKSEYDYGNVKTIENEIFGEGSSAAAGTITEDFKNLYPAIAEKLSDVVNERATEYDFLVSDIIFLSTRSEYSNTDDLSLQNMFTSEYVNNNKMKVVPFRWYSYIDENDCHFNPSADSDKLLTVEGGDESSAAPDTALSGYNISDINLRETTVAGYIIPLDVGILNVERLANIIRNKNIIPSVIDFMRQHPERSPYLNPQEATSLIPAAIIFRKLKYRVISDDTGAKIKELIAMDFCSEVSSRSTVEEGNRPGRFHPANVLSFFDLQYKANQLNPINFKSDNIYKVLPVIY